MNQEIEYMLKVMDFCFAKNMRESLSNKYGQKLLDSAKNLQQMQ